MLDYNMRKAVNAGSCWLDSNFVGWWEKINLDDLDLGDCVTCVLGQALGGYTDGLVTLLIDVGEEKYEMAHEYSKSHGFTGFKGVPQKDRFWRALTNMWKKEIVKRRAQQDTIHVQEQELVETC